MSTPDDYRSPSNSFSFPTLYSGPRADSIIAIYHHPPPTTTQETFLTLQMTHRTSETHSLSLLSRSGPRADSIIGIYHHHHPPPGNFSDTPDDS